MSVRRHGLAEIERLKVRPLGARRAGALWGLCLLLLVAWALHWRTFGVEELGQDGNLSVDLGLGSLGAMLVYTARDVHPPLFFALLHWAFAFGGPGYLVAKIVPIAAAQLSLLVLYRLVRVLAGTLVAWWAVFLLLLSVPFLFLAPTVRPFTLGLFCSLLTVYLTARSLTAPGRPARRQLMILLPATTAALLSWYLQLFVVALEALLFWRAQRLVTAEDGELAAVRRDGLLALAAGALLAAPWYAFVLPNLLAKMRQGATVTEGTPTLPTIGGVVAGLGQAFVGRPGGTLTSLALLGGALALLIGLWCCLARGRLGAENEFPQRAVVGAAPRGRPDARPPVAAAVASPASRDRGPTDRGRPGRLTGIARIWAAGLGRPRGAAPTTIGSLPHCAVCPSRQPLLQSLLFAGLALGTLEVVLILARWQHPDAAGRYVLGLLPFVVTLQALALTARSTRLRLVATLGVALALGGQLAWFGGLLAIPPNEYEKDGESNFLLTHLQPGDGVLFSDHGRRGLFLLNRRFTTVYPTAVVQTSGDRYLGDTAAQAAQAVTALLGQTPRLWYMNTEERPDRPRLGQAALASRAFIVSQTRAGDSDLSLFLTRQPNVHRSLNVTFGGAVTLVAAAYSDRPGPADGVSVDLTWRDDRALPGPYSVFVHLDGADGKLLAQHDGVPEAGLRPTQQWRPGEVIDDRHGLLVPAGLPPDAYALDVGIYQVGASRLTLPDGGNQIRIGTVEVGG